MRTMLYHLCEVCCTSNLFLKTSYPTKHFETNKCTDITELTEILFQLCSSNMFHFLITRVGLIYPISTEANDLIEEIS